MIRRYAEQGPAAICNALNMVIRRCIDNPAYFATLFIAIHDPEGLEWRCMNCGHPNPVYLRAGTAVDSAMFSKGGGTPIGFPFGDETPFSEADEIHFKNEGDTFLLLYTDGLTEARHVRSGEECGGKIESFYEQVVQDPARSDKSGALLDTMESAGYRLGGDDCTAISIHMLDPLKVLIEQTVLRNIYLVSDVARQCEVAVMTQGISRDTAGLLRLLVMELGANLVEHGGLGEDDSFWLQVRVDGNVCQLVLVDEGEEWNLEEALGRRLDDAYMGERGRGLAITNAVSDRIERYRVDDENTTYCTIIDQEDA
jgi:anti-sigma regulatory factor (Ser/Thr protein kinase)